MIPSYKTVTKRHLAYGKKFVNIQADFLKIWNFLSWLNHYYFLKDRQLRDQKQKKSELNLVRASRSSVSNMGGSVEKELFSPFWGWSQWSNEWVGIDLFQCLKGSRGNIEAQCNLLSHGITSKTPFWFIFADFWIKFHQKSIIIEYN